MILTGRSQYIVSILLSFAWQVHHLEAQESAGYTKIVTASFSQLTLGASTFSFPAMTNYLKRDDLLGSAYRYSDHWYHAGTEMSICAYRFTVSVGGLATTPLRGTSPRGDTRLSMRGAFLRTGYRLKPDSRAFKNVYAGVGLMRFNFVLNNIDSGDLWSGSEYRLKTGKNELFRSDHMVYDVGFSYRIAVASKRSDNPFKSGLVIGLESGCMILSPVNSWRTGQQVVPVLPKDNISFMPYIKLSFGPGGYVVLN